MSNGLLKACSRRLLGWARSRSMKAICLSSQCCPLNELPCGVELADVPESADLMIVAGPIGSERARIVRKIYDRMPMPRAVIALGSCACASGDAAQSAADGGSGCAVPVDLYVAGCPPEGKEIARVIEMLLKIVKDRGEEKDDVQGSD